VFLFIGGGISSDDIGIGNFGLSSTGKPGGTGGGEIFGRVAVCRRINLSGVEREDTGMGIFGWSDCGRLSGLGGGDIFGSVIVGARLSTCRFTILSLRARTDTRVHY
jgi:hypothetical protein